MNKKHQLISWSMIAAIVVLSGLCYWWYRGVYPTTDDAYVNANVIHIAAQVTGPVSAIYVHDHQKVKKGQLLFTIDPRPFQYAVNKASADLQLATQQMNADVDAVKVARAQVDDAKAQVIWSKKNAWRLTTLAKGGQTAQSDADQAVEENSQAQANLKAAQNQLSQAIENLGTPGERNAQIQDAKATLQNAQINLSYTKIYASTSGYIDNFTLRPGSMVTAEQTQFELVASKQWWVDANYEETKLKRIQPGQTATISIDSYPGIKFHGIVDSIARGSGTAFSLLPPENATGNWVKVTQRIPVKVIILDPNPKYPLIVGASAYVKIDTHHHNTQTIKNSA